MLRGVHHVAIATADLERLQAFYCNLLGMRPITSGEWSDNPVNDGVVGLPRSAARFVLLAAGNFALEIFQYSNPPSIADEQNRPVNKPGITHIAFSVTDLDAEHARLQEAGVRFHGPPAPRADPSETPIRAVYGRDPDGNAFELLEIIGETSFDYVPAMGSWRG
jgi:catechol 2,3-dioxygenase-like lactoylglutathione lyase family enzyme